MSMDASLAGSQTTRNGYYWMQTFTGRAVFPMDMRPEEIWIEDIAHALSMQCRYAGHCNKFESVAEHCVLLATVIPKHKLEALMHDSPEAYLIDVPRPVKRHLNGYYDIEANLARTVATRFELIYPTPDIVSEYDQRILLDERNQNMTKSPLPLGDGWPDWMEPLGVTLQYWEPEVAEQKFLEKFSELLGHD